MKDSKIEWCDNTFNPWIGCTKVSPGCANCYAEKSTFARVKRSQGVETWGKGATRVRTKPENWKDPVKWNRQAAIEGTRPRVFCASLSDWLDDEVPIEWLADLLQLIAETPNLDWLLLTKRPQNWAERVDAVFLLTGADEPSFIRWEEAHLMVQRWMSQGAACKIPDNIWIGTTVEDQTRAEQRIPKVLEIPAKVHFLSCEPLLGEVDLETVYLHETCDHCESRVFMNALSGLIGCDGGCDGPEMIKTIDWVICGGESGDNARPMHPAWARSLRDQCTDSGVPFLFKQWGNWLPDLERDFQLNSGDKITWGLVHLKGSFRLVLNKGTRDWDQSPGWLDGEQGVANVGKDKAGRFLQFRTWDELPKASISQPSTLNQQP